jgi:hypothetical protein
LAPRMNPIEAIALMDRSFQQRRLLEGNSTANISTISKIVLEAHEITPVQAKPAVLEADVLPGAAHEPAKPARNVVDIEVEAHGKR